ncbi:NFX1-type zinc finger-containing protein 1 [Mytilus coruscus]|uniref:NFX1-type zinc finger-containing protein 1 n=1 Tax=Mytilus coruscus TaxID=42192 RepID=A0A6J8BIK6_MYTCO|nr:NFX1-type zinc finger-containing protein 1 [Mytilus coruscus]
MIRTEDRNISKKDEVVICPGILSREDEPSVRITTVDNFQGEENDIILFSLVRSNMENEIGFLSEANRVCVALSRAKIGLYVVGNFELLTSKSGLWKNIVNDADKRQSVGSKLISTCQTHKNSTYVSKPDDFDLVTDSGCQKPCKIKRQCGHFCLRKCHVDDPDHEGICPKQCHRQVCELGHRCIKPCHYQNSCEKCNAIVVKTIPKCQHRKQMPCHEDPQSASCDKRCQAIISCGHRCQKQCTDPCNIEDDCKELVKINARCGHEVHAPCYTKYDAPCKLPCKGILKCGHECKGTHSECSQGRLHKPCEAKCERNLVYGHNCKDHCNNRCPPCTQICDCKCIHGDRCKTDVVIAVYSVLNFVNGHVKQNLQTNSSVAKYYETLHETVPSECRWLLKTWLDGLETWVFLRRRRYARQEHNEFYLEIRRLQLILYIHKFKTELYERDEGLALADIMENYLLKLESVEIVEEEELSKMRKETEEVSSKMIDLTLKEKQRIKRVVRNEFSGSGHWYKCKKGHYYSVGECGMPMEKIKCPQCCLAEGGVIIF